MEETPVDLTLMEPVSPETLMPGPSLLPWIILGAVLLVLFILCVVAVIMIVKAVGKTTPPPYQAAYSDAKASLDQIQSLSARETAVECSLILRTYLSKAFNDPALFETHEEFISRQDSLASLTPETKAATQNGFSELAKHKYSQDTPSDDAQAIVANSKTLLETLNRGFFS